jgi:flagellar hook-associated protein 2
MSVTLGTFFQSGGKTVMGGAGGSGIDTQTLVKALTDAKGLPATQDQTKITANDAKTTALGTFQTLLSTLSTSVAALRNPPGVGNAADDAFKYRTASITSNTGVSGSSYISVTAAAGTAIQSYTISDITSLASGTQQSTGAFNIATADAAAVSATPAAGQFQAGSFTIKGQPLTFNDGESLNSVAAKFNSISDKTGISASIVQISTGKYQLSFSATKTGTDNAFDFNNLAPAGTLVDGSGVFLHITIDTKQTASDAIFSLNGTPITRSSNTVSDLVDGLTFNINQVTPDSNTKIGIGIVADQTIAKNSIIAFVNAYNALKVFAAQQFVLDANGTYASTAVLHDNTAFRDTMSSVNSQISTIVSGITGTDPKNLSDVGITLADQAATSTTPQVSNILTVDDTKLAAAINSNPDAVRKVFEFNFVSDNTSVRVVSRTNSLGVSNFSLNINPATSTYQATYNNGSHDITVNLSATAIKNASSGLVTGYTLKGQAGTPLEGLTLLYANTSAGTANITTTQGIADKIFNITDPALTADTGSLAVELASIKSSNTRLTDEIAKINAQVDIYRQQLLEQFSRMEQAIANVNNIISSITASDNARNNANN